MSTDHENPDPDDMFADTRMSFGDHIEDLRTHLFRALKGFAVGMILGIWPFGQYVFAIIVAPVEDQLYQFELRKLEREMIEAANRRENEKRESLPTEVRIAFPRAQFEQKFGIKGDANDTSEFVELDARIQDPRPLFDQMLKDQIDVRRPKMSTMHITESF